MQVESSTKYKIPSSTAQKSVYIYIITICRAVNQCPRMSHQADVILSDF